MAKGQDDGGYLRDWLELGDELRVINPERYSEVLECVREIVEVQRLLAAHDQKLVLRDRRPTKRYSA